MIYSLRDSAAQDPRLTGGKASTLAQLLVAGFPIPDGFVVTDPRTDVAPYLTPEALFAIRSSGYAEDSADHSFAGQYETFLGVRGIVNVSSAISRCFDSFSNNRSVAYRESRDAGAAGGAVLIQALVEAEAAGVAFTVDPVTGATDRVLIESNLGLGESVVSGKVTPDAFVVIKASGEIAERRIEDKRLKSVLDHSGSRLEEIQEPLRRAPSISDDTARAIAELALQVEKHYGQPVDIEWAWRLDRVYLLQARPVTTTTRTVSLPREGWAPELNTAIDARFPLYSSGNVSEILPGCVTPLTYSLFSRGVEKAFRNVAEYLGSMPDVGPKPVVVGFFFHRVYLNASYFMTAADNSPGASRDTVYEDLIGPSTIRHPAWKWSDLLPWNAWRGLRILTRFLGLQGRLDKDIAACRSNYESSLKAMESRPPSAWDNRALADWLVTSEAGLEPAIIHIRASQFATSSFATLRSLTRRWLDDSQEVLAANLVTGIGALASTAPSKGLYELAQLVFAEPELRALFAENRDDRRLAAIIAEAESTNAKRLHSALESFIHRHGHRGFREAELRNPCWREDPASVVAHVRKHLEPGTISPGEIERRQAELHQQARAAALSRLSGLRRAFFLSILTGARKHIAAREEMKNLLLLFLDLTRRVLSEAQLRLKDVFVQPGDMYFLLDRELADALRGSLSREDTQAIVTRRRADFERASLVYVPKIQEGSARFLEKPEGDFSSSELRGVPVSPGQVEGLARVVFDPSVADLKQGEILVTPVTDIAWTPLFLRAAGLVVEVGGPLSHGSIVAREYGIPAVTAVAGATRRIRTGDRLHIDGDRGIILILGEKEAP